MSRSVSKFELTKSIQNLFLFCRKKWSTLYQGIKKIPGLITVKKVSATPCYTLDIVQFAFSIRKIRVSIRYNIQIHLKTLNLEATVVICHVSSKSSPIIRNSCSFYFDLEIARWPHGVVQQTAKNQLPPIANIIQNELKPRVLFCFVYTTSGRSSTL